MDSFLTMTKIGLKLEMEFLFVLGRLNLLLKLSISPFLLFTLLPYHVSSRVHSFQLNERFLPSFMMSTRQNGKPTKRRKLVNSKLPMLFSLFLSPYFLPPSFSSFCLSSLSFYSLACFSIDTSVLRARINEFSTGNYVERRASIARESLFLIKKELEKYIDSFVLYITFILKKKVNQSRSG